MDHAATMRNTYELISAGDIDGFGDLVADDFVEHQGGPGFPEPRRGRSTSSVPCWLAFPDLHMDVEDLIAAGDKTVARVRTSGTHRGTSWGSRRPAVSGKMQLIDIMRFDGSGLVCEHWGVADMLSLMQQLGVVPADAPA